MPCTSILFQKLYINGSKSLKVAISKTIVQAMRLADPPARFLAKDVDTNLWYEVGDQKASEKTSQTLREGAACFKREQEKEAVMDGVEALKQLSSHSVGEQKDDKDATLSPDKMKRILREEAINLDTLNEIYESEFEKFASKKTNLKPRPARLSHGFGSSANKAGTVPEPPIFLATRFGSYREEDSVTSGYEGNDRTVQFCRVADQSAPLRELPVYIRIPPRASTYDEPVAQSGLSPATGRVPSGYKREHGRTLEEPEAKRHQGWLYTDVPAGHYRPELPQYAAAGSSKTLSSALEEKLSAWRDTLSHLHPAAATLSRSHIPASHVAALSTGASPSGSTQVASLLTRQLQALGATSTQPSQDRTEIDYAQLAKELGTYLLSVGTRNSLDGASTSINMAQSRDNYGDMIQGLTSYLESRTLGHQEASLLSPQQATSVAQSSQYPLQQAQSNGNNEHLIGAVQDFLSASAPAAASTSAYPLATANPYLSPAGTQAQTSEQYREALLKALGYRYM